ncbi:unnamed protein product [Lupinus luteus]|uniref:Protein DETOXIFICATION n=1 Tax=Lupinus luteus TaxID=3873 RepID=A0AAV1YED9_LUPLU
MSSTSTLNDKTNEPATLPPPVHGYAGMLNKDTVISELKVQATLSLPIAVMNLAWFGKTAITTIFLGRLGELTLAGGALGITFANVTGFAILNGICGAVEAICGQAQGAQNIKLLHKTLVMTILLLCFISVPITFLWIHIDRVLISFGQQVDISIVARDFVSYLVPDLFITSFFCPLKAYLSSQSITLPTMFISIAALVIHIPINIALSKAMGLKGVSMAVWITDLIIVVLLILYVVILEKRGSRWKVGGWWDQSFKEWITLVKLGGSCCLNACLEWWCYEILVLLSGHLKNAQEAVGVLAIVLNLENLFFSVILSLGTSVSTRVSNELGANQPDKAYASALVSLALGFILGWVGGLLMVAIRGGWAALFTHDKGIINGVKKIMLFMALGEVFNFPLAVCGGILRGVLSVFKFHGGLVGLFIGLIIGIITCLTLDLVFIVRTNWVKAAAKAQILANDHQLQNVPKHDAEELSTIQENHQA